MTNQDASATPGQRAEIEKSPKSDDRPERPLNGLARQVGKRIREKGLTIAVGETFTITVPPKP